MKRFLTSLLYPHSRPPARKPCFLVNLVRSSGARTRNITQFYISVACLLTLPLLPGCAESGAANDCLIQAARAKSELPRDAWSRLLLVKYHGGNLGHVYMIYELPGHAIFAYDTVFGSRRIKPRSLFLPDVLSATDGRASFGFYLDEHGAGAALPR